jgi:hypothetical protein
MKLTKATTDLVCELEHIIGSQCYNPNSLNGYTWEEGLEFRYPVWYENKEGKDIRTNSIIKNLDKSKIVTIRYKFGSNHLYIGEGIVRVLELLEKKYDLDFSELAKHKK